MDNNLYLLQVLRGMRGKLMWILHGLGLTNFPAEATFQFFTVGCIHKGQARPVIQFVLGFQLPVVNVK